MEACVNSCIVRGRPTRQGTYLRFPEPFVIAWSRRSSWRSDMTLGRGMSVATGRECIGTAFHSVGKMPRIYRSMYDLRSIRAAASFSAIPNHALACRSPIHQCGDMGLCSLTACLVAVLNGEFLTGLTQTRQLSGRNELWPRFGPVPASNTLATGRCNPALTPTEMQAR